VIDLQPASDQGQSSFDEIATFLVAVGTVLREAIVRFEETTARITENVTARADRTDRDLVVMLQDFDRLQQQFVTLAELLIRAAAKSPDSWSRCDGGGHPAEDAVEAISLADVKSRLMRHLNYALIDLSLAPTGDEAVY
jgi:hypothetical protein